MSEYLKPRVGGIRNPTDTSQNNGKIVNPPRMSGLGGFDKSRERNGHFKNDKVIRKPGGSRSK